MVVEMKLKYKEVQPGDILVNWDVMVTAVYADEDGLWVETDDEECGYVNPNAIVEVEH